MFDLKEKVQGLFTQAANHRVSAVLYKWQNEYAKSQEEIFQYKNIKTEFENLLGTQQVEKFEALLTQSKSPLCLQEDLKNTLSCFQEEAMIGLNILDEMIL